METETRSHKRSMSDLTTRKYIWVNNMVRLHEATSIAETKDVLSGLPIVPAQCLTIVSEVFQGDDQERQRMILWCEERHTNRHRELIANDE